MKETQTKKHIFAHIGRIYLGIVKRLGSFFAFILGSIAVAAVIVLPVWYFAKNFRLAYSIVVLAGIAAALLFFLIRKILRTKKLSDGSKRFSFVRFLWQFFFILLLIAWVYFIIIVLLRGMIGPAIILMVAFLPAFGFYLYGKNKTKVQNSN